MNGDRGPLIQSVAFLTSRRYPRSVRKKVVRAITATVKKAGYEFTETFLSPVDAEAWQLMVGTTLEDSEKITFDVHRYATGLAKSVRTYGGEITKHRWLNVEVPHERWILGLPVAIDHDRMIDDALSDRKAMSCKRPSG
jgi:hypothetical protein